jgi:hypothetical protein
MKKKKDSVNYNTHINHTQTAENFAEEYDDEEFSSVKTKYIVTN